MRAHTKSKISSLFEASRPNTTTYLMIKKYVIDKTDIMPKDIDVVEIIKMMNNHYFVEQVTFSSTTWPSY